MTPPIIDQLIREGWLFTEDWPIHGDACHFDFVWWVESDGVTCFAPLNEQAAARMEIP